MCVYMDVPKMLVIVESGLVRVYKESFSRAQLSNRAMPGGIIDCAQVIKNSESF